MIHTKSYEGCSIFDFFLDYWLLANHPKIYTFRTYGRHIWLFFYYKHFYFVYFCNVFNSFTVIISMPQVVIKFGILDFFCPLAYQNFFEQNASTIILMCNMYSTQKQRKIKVVFFNTFIIYHVFCSIEN